jgi:hypothetical protein
MSKTIEIASIHKGPVAVPVKGESRTITFEDKGDVGYAMVDHDEAAVLLKLSGDFWKPGARTATEAVETAVASLDGEAAVAAEDIKQGGRGRKKTEE